VAQSSELVEKDIFTKDVYNNLRKDVLDPSLGHGHHGDADTGVQIILSGTYAAIPTASSDNKGWLYLATDRGVLYRSDGVTWSQCGVALDLDETIAGVKTFSSIPILPGIDPTVSNEAVRKAYVDKVANPYLKLGLAEPVIEFESFGPGASIELGPADAGETWLCYVVGGSSPYIELYFGILKDTTWRIRQVWTPEFVTPPVGETWIIPVTIGNTPYEAGPVIGGVATLVDYTFLDPVAPVFFVVTNSTPLRIKNSTTTDQYLGYAGWKV